MTAYPKLAKLLRDTWNKAWTDARPPDDATMKAWEAVASVVMEMVNPPAEDRGRLCVEQIPGKGRGIIACRPFRADEIIEIAPVIPFDHTQDLPKELEDKPLAWTDTHDCIVLGLCQLVNHSDEPNTEREYDHGAQTITLRAIRAIVPGEEITYRYKTLWFKPSEDRGDDESLFPPKPSRVIGKLLPSNTGEEVEGVVERLRAGIRFTYGPHNDGTYYYTEDANKVMKQAASLLSSISEERDKLQARLNYAFRPGKSMAACLQQLAAARAEISRLTLEVLPKMAALTSKKQAEIERLREALEAIEGALILLRVACEQADPHKELLLRVREIEAFVDGASRSALTGGA